MKHILLSSILITIGTHAIGQSTIAEFSLPKNELINLQFFRTGDSILISFIERRIDKADKKAIGYMIPRVGWLAGNEIKFVYRPEKEIGAFISMISTRDEIYLYFFEKVKSTRFLKTLTYNRNTGNLKEVSDGVEIKGNVMFTFVDHGMMYVIAHHKSGVLIVHQIKGKALINQSSILLPKNVVKDFEENFDVELFETGPFINTKVGCTSKKLIVNNGQLYLVVDTKKPSTTTIISIQLADFSFKTYRFTQEGKWVWTSFINENILYQLSINAVNNVQTLTICSFSIDPFQQLFKKELATSQFKEYASYYKHIWGGVRYKNKYFNPDDDYGKISLVATVEDENVIMRVGSVDRQSSPGQAISADPILSMAYFIGSIHSQQLEEPNVIANYVYLSGTKDLEKLELPDQNDNSTITIQQKIDNYEIDLYKSSNIKGKHYLVEENSIVAVYYLKKEDKLLFVKF